MSFTLKIETYLDIGFKDGYCSLTASVEYTKPSYESLDTSFLLVSIAKLNTINYTLNNYKHSNLHKLP